MRNFFQLGIRSRLRERAIDAFVAPRDDDLAQLNTADLTEGALRRSFLDEIVGDEYELLDQLRVRVAEQEAAERLAAELVAEAEADRVDVEERLRALDESRAEAEDLRAEVQERVAAWQLISDEIEEADRLIEEEIRLLEEEARRAQEEAAAAEEEARRLAEEEAARLAEEEAAAAADPEANDEGAEGAEGGDAAPEADDETAEGEEADGADEDGDAEAEPDGDPEPAPTGGFAVTHRPVPGIVTSPFGDRVHPIFGTVRAHKGLDLDGDTGDPIVAATDGVVLSAGWRNGYGNTVVISHGDGYTTLYAHQTDVNVAAGASVSGGDVIGWVGSTGWSTGSHLHFEVRLDGVALDPAQFM